MPVYKAGCKIGRATNFGPRQHGCKKTGDNFGVFRTGDIFLGVLKFLSEKMDGRQKLFWGRATVLAPLYTGIPVNNCQRWEGREKNGHFFVNYGVFYEMVVFLKKICPKD